MSAPSTNAANHMDFNYLQRVKVYRLNDEGRWDDKGTGHVSVEYLERSEALGMVVIDEEDHATLLVHRISADDIYRKQEDTIISWTDPEVATDLALSFQEAMGCAFIWEQIRNVQTSVQFSSVGALDSGPRAVTDELEHSGTSQDDDDVFHDSGNSEISELPPIELSSLPQIVKSIAEADKDRIASLIIREQSYIPKLMELFRICEDLENIEGLHMLFKIVKGIILLNDRHVFDFIFTDEYIMDIVGTLEYDPELSSHQDHRGFLKNQVVFKEAVPIRDPAILSKIHQTYRIGYIKDVILPRVLDDQTFATINSMMLSNNKGVVSALHNDKTFISELFTKLRSPSVPEETRRELVFFLHEFCNLSKNLQPFYRSELFCSLVEKGLFEVITSALESDDANLRVSGSDILIVILNHDATLLRTFLVQQPGHLLFSLLVKNMLTPTEGGLQAQILEMMRMLLDSDPADRQQVDKNAYLDVFYEKYMDQLVEVLTTACPAKGTTEPKRISSPTDKQAAVSAEILGNICELMCFCVLHHGYRIKYYVMRNNVVEKVLRLVRRREKTLVVAAVRFLRTCVGLKDEFYDRYLVKKNLFEPVIQAFLANGNRYNLLNSAVLELIDFIRKSNIKSLMTHLVENYGEKLEAVDYVDTIQLLKRKYEQSLEAPPVLTREVSAGATGSESGSERLIGPLPDSRKRKDDRALDKDEEEYFNEDSDDEEDTNSVRTSGHAAQAIVINGNSLGDVPFRPFGLVDYDDEEDDSPLPFRSNGKESPPGKKSEGAQWSDMENLPVTKRKSSLESPGEATFQKRHKQENMRAKCNSDSETARNHQFEAEVNKEGRYSQSRIPDERSEGKLNVYGRHSDQAGGSNDIGNEVDRYENDGKREFDGGKFCSRSRDEMMTSRSSPGPERVSVGFKVHSETKPRISPTSPEASSSR